MTRIDVPTGSSAVAPADPAPADPAPADTPPAKPAPAPESAAAPLAVCQGVLGLLPPGCTAEVPDLVLLANPEVPEAGLCVEDFATEACQHALALQRNAVRWRLAAGASEEDARAAVLTSGGIDVARLFGVPSEPKAVAEVLFKQDRKRKERDE